MIRTPFRTGIARSATTLLILLGLAACAGPAHNNRTTNTASQVSYPVPDQPGIYAYTSNSDIRRVDGDPNWEASTWPNRANLPSNVRFVVNDPQLANRSPGSTIELWRVAWVRSEVNASNQAMPLNGTEWVVAPVTPYSVPIRYESPSNKSSVVNITPTAPLTPGLYTLRINEPGARQARIGIGWDGLDQRQYAAMNCVDRYLGEGGIYRPCTAVVAAQPLAVVPGGSVAYSPGVSVPTTGLGTMVVPTAPAMTLPAANVMYPGLDIALGEPMRRNNGLLIQGTITNNTGQVLMVPAMQAMLQDASGRDLQRWVFHPPVTTLAPGARTAFTTEVRPVTPGVANATVAFAQ